MLKFIKNLFKGNRWEFNKPDSSYQAPPYQAPLAQKPTKYNVRRSDYTQINSKYYNINNGSLVENVILIALLDDIFSKVTNEKFSIDLSSNTHPTNNSDD